MRLSSCATDPLLGNADRLYLASVFDPRGEERKVRKSEREHPNSQIFDPFEVFAEANGKVYIVLAGLPWRQILHPGNGAGGWKASPKREIQLTAKLREEMEFWRLLDEWDRHIPWKDEKLWVLSASTDASLSPWAGVIHCQPDDVVLRDFWGSDLAEININVKEMWAIAKVLESLPPDIRDCRVDVQVDNHAVIHTWMGRRGRSRELTKVAQHFFPACDTDTLPPPPPPPLL